MESLFPRAFGTADASVEPRLKKASRRFSLMASRSYAPSFYFRLSRWRKSVDLS